MVNRIAPYSWKTFSVKDVINNVSIGNKIPSKKYLERGLYPVIDQGRDYISGYTNNENGVITSIPVIIFGDHTRVFKYVDFSFVPGADGVKIFRAKSFFIPKLLFYFLQAVILPDRGYARHYQYLAKSTIPVPPMAEQKRIVKKIEELFAVIDKTVKSLNETKEHLAQYRQSVLQQAFSGKLHKTTVWNQNSLNALCRYIQRGKSPKYITYSALPVINQKCIRWKELQIQYLKFIDPIQFGSWIRERHVQPMDILWNSTGTGTIGRAYLYQGTELTDAVVDSHVTIVRADVTKINPHFLFFYIQSPFIQRKIEKMQSGSTNQVELVRKEIQNIQINLPSLPEQKAIVAKIETAFAAADKAEKAISAALEQAQQLKQSILKQAFEGNLVPQDPNDEPVDLSQIKKHKGKSK
ncbi:restriction endonuclease subunit S [Candidatus Proelusimicrobium excrementi]|uniref:restriction endonuclease subunit S n=1 Tax=Candidatus Proelusimicrobium excrementi TaxID=3416222 RepID=UPI003D14724B